MSIQGTRDGFRMTNEQSDYNYWHDRMSGDVQFIQYMTELYMKQQLEVQAVQARDPTNRKMTHRSPPSSSSPPSTPRNVRHLPNLMDHPIAPVLPQQKYQNDYNHVKRSSVQPPRPNDNPASSTPRRPLDESSSPANLQQRQNKKSRPHETTPSIIPMAPTTDHTTTAPRPQHFHFPPVHLKHALSNNLPCFYIKFISGNNQFQLPSAMKAAGWVRQVIQQQSSLPFGDFSLFIPAGHNRFKFGVTSKNDFLKLWNCKWPEEMNKIKVEIERPRALPDCCALVVRHVPNDLSNDFVVSEVNKTITSSVSFSRINYHRPRPTNDYRFCVTDGYEYEEALNVGRISIGHILLPITAFIPSLKMTYCTNCWELGHTRQKCKTNARCRTCLDVWDYNHQCQKPIVCAQCKGPHSSLSMECSVVRNYRRLLKEEVNNAVKDGLINQVEGKGIVDTFHPTAVDFPTIGKANDTRIIWGSVQGHVNDKPNRHENVQLSELLTRVNDVLDSTHRMETKMDNQNSRMDMLENRTAINKDGIIALANLIQQTINTILEKKNKQQLLKLCQQIEDFKNDTLQKFNEHPSDQQQKSNHSLSQPINKSAQNPTTSVINENNNTQQDQEQSMELVNE